MANQKFKVGDKVKVICGMREIVLCTAGYPGTVEAFNPKTNMYTVNHFDIGIYRADELEKAN